jgi:hypothetical protein
MENPTEILRFTGSVASHIAMSLTTLGVWNLIVSQVHERQSQESETTLKSGFYSCYAGGVLAAAAGTLHFALNEFSGETKNWVMDNWIYLPINSLLTVTAKLLYDYTEPLRRD